MASEHPRYRIATLDDFLAVPEERQEACLAEFAAFLLMMRATQRNSPRYKVTAQAFTWTDDNAPGVQSITLEPGTATPWGPLLIVLVLVGFGALLGWLVAR